MSRVLGHVGAVVLLLGLAACGDAVTPADPAPSASSTAGTGPSDPLALVGRWHVEAEGAAAGTAVRFGEEMTLFLDCGVMDGSWRADGEQSLFLADTYSGDGGCSTPDGTQAPPWLRAAVGFRVEGESRVLVDAQGRATAMLRPGATPTVGPNRVRDFESPPTISPAMRDAAQPAAPLPAGATPATVELLAKRWLPADGAGAGRAFLVFARDGAFAGSDGCNGQGGRFLLGSDGRLLATTGIQTLIGCEGAPVGSWVHQAARAGIVSGRLVLYDARAQVVGELVPAPSAAS